MTFRELTPEYAKELVDNAPKEWRAIECPYCGSMIHGGIFEFRKPLLLTVLEKHISCDTVQYYDIVEDYYGQYITHEKID